MRPEELQELFGNLEEMEETVIRLDDLDEAILGSAQTAVLAKEGGAHTITVLVYSLRGIVEILMTRDNMDAEEALEFFDYNILRALPYTLGEGVGSPVIVQDLDS